VTDFKIVEGKSEKEVLPLDANIEGYWKKDLWYATQLPLKNNDPSKHKQENRYPFDCPSQHLNNEIKYFLIAGFESNRWKPWTGNLPVALRKFTHFLKEVRLQTQSILELSVEKWEDIAEQWILKNKIKGSKKITFRIKTGQLKTYNKLNHPLLNFIRGLHSSVCEYFDQRSDWEKGVITPKSLNLRIENYSPKTINLNRIKPEWLRELLIKYIKRRTDIKWGTIASLTESLFYLSQFILEKREDVTKSMQIDQKFIEAFAHYLRIKIKNDGTYSNILYNLRTFQEYCAKHKMAPFEQKRIVPKEIFPKYPRIIPDFIPQHVILQIEDNTYGLEDPYRTILKILFETGARVGEICGVHFDCIDCSQNSWEFSRIQFKTTNKDHTIPITCELAETIKQQQLRVKKTFGNSPKYLFPNINLSSEKPISFHTFNNRIRKFIFQNNITDLDGSLWQFSSKQCRHTVGTTMINAGISQKTVQLFLGQTSSTITQRYAHIYDETLKIEFAKFHGKVINSDGNIIEENFNINSVENQWLKHNITAQALPNGYCVLPSNSGDCPHVNSCLDCAHFRTTKKWLPILIDELKRGEELEKYACNNKLERMQRLNERSNEKRRKIIDIIKKD